MNKGILITGASGVLGRLLTEEMQRRGRTVFLISSRKNELVEKYDDDIRIRCFDLNDFSKGVIPVGEVDTVFHCAFARTEKGRELAKSITFTQELFIWCIESGVRRVVNVSSQSIYGNYREKPSFEDGPIDPLDAYAIAKLACEHIGDILFEGSSSVLTHVRLASLIGPQFKERLVYKMLRAASHDRKLSVVGGSQIFSFLDVRDAVLGLSAMLEVEPSKWQRVYNLGTGEYYSLFHIAESVANLVMSKKGGEVALQLSEADIQRKILLDCGRFYADFNWRASISFNETLEYIYAKCEQEIR